MTGTLINAATIAAGGLVGLLIKKGIPKHVEESVTKMTGLVVAFIGLSGMMQSMFTVDATTGRISESGSLILLVSLVVGTVVGELLRLSDRLDSFGAFIEQKVGAEGFAKGFISATLVFVIGAMSIIGALDEGLTGNYSTLLVKSTLDGITSIVLASAFGVGVMFAAVPVLIFQGSITLMAGFLAPIISPELLDMICMVGYAIVVCIGLNFLVDAKIKTANLLPALLGPIVYNLLSMLKTL